MAEETITYELIRRIQRDEENLSKLTPLPENFYENVAKYLEQKRKLAENKNEKVAEVELKNIERLIEDIYNRRERKVLNHALIHARTGLPAENMGDEEKTFYENLISIIKLRRNSSLKNIFIKTSDILTLKKVKFKEAVPEFVAMDMNIYGPFEMGQEAVLPQENAQILIVKGSAEAI